MRRSRTTDKGHGTGLLFASSKEKKEKKRTSQRSKISGKEKRESRNRRRLFPMGVMTKKRRLFPAACNGKRGKDREVT